MAGTKQLHNQATTWSRITIRMHGIRQLCNRSTTCRRGIKIPLGRGTLLLSQDKSFGHRVATGLHRHRNRTDKAAGLRVGLLEKKLGPRSTSLTAMRKVLMSHRRVMPTLQDRWREDLGV